MYNTNGTVLWYSGLQQLDVSTSDTLTSANFDWRELAREVQDAYNMRPSVVTEAAPPPPEAGAAGVPGAMPPGMPPGLPGAAPMGAPAMMPPGMAPGMEGGAPMDPAMMAALLGGQPPVAG